MQVLTSLARDCRERSTFVTLRHTTHALVRPGACGRRLRRHRTGEVSATKYRVLGMPSRDETLAVRGVARAVCACVHPAVRVCVRVPIHASGEPTYSRRCSGTCCHTLLTLRQQQMVCWQVSGSGCSSRSTRSTGVEHVESR